MGRCERDTGLILTIADSVYTVRDRPLMDLETCQIRLITRTPCNLFWQQVEYQTFSIRY